jgi:hypothetical protein
MTTFAFVAEGFDGSWQKIPHAGFQMKSTSNVEEPNKLAVAWNARQGGEPFQGTTKITVAPVAHAGTSLPERFDLSPYKTNCIVTGSAGPMSVQNVEGEFGGMGLDVPQGMVLSLATDSVRIVRPTTRRPRLAALAGGLSAIAGELPFGSNFDIAKPVMKNLIKLHWSYQVKATVWDGQYYAEINETWLKVFGNFPFSHMKIYCVDKLYGKPLAQFFQLNVSHIRNKEVYFKETSSDLQEFIFYRLMDYPDAERLSDASFLSMYFVGNNGYATKYLANYDMEHPFIVYVELTPDLLGRTEIVMKTHEIPPFSFYRKFKEYR